MRRSHLKRSIVTRLFAGLVAALSLALGSPQAFAQEEQPVAPDVVIDWDQWKVPHIRGESSAAVAYGFGWAQAKNHPELLLKLYGEARGRAAEYWGADHVSSDSYVRTLGIPAHAARLLAHQLPEERAIYEAFAQGVNDYYEKHSSVIGPEYAQVLPIRVVDVLAHVQKVLFLDFVARQERVLRQIQDAPVETPGSNGWAVGPSRSASGNALLMANPHLAWADQWLFFEAQLIRGDDRAYGVALIGWPALVIAFNERLGWTHTVNTYDGADLYKFPLSEDGEYRFGNSSLPLQVNREVLKVREADGSLSEKELVVESSTHGPIIRRTDSVAYSLRVAGLTDLNHGAVVGQYWDMAFAKSFEEYKSALRRLQMPMFNTIYADREGQIFYAFNALMPKRSVGDVAFWTNEIDGQNPALVWTDYRDFDDLPQYLNPDGGFIQNGNDAPWTSTFPQALDPQDFPSDTAPQFMFSRPQSATKMLLSDSSITFEEIVDYRASTRVFLADVVLDDLIEAAEGSDSELIRDAAAVLAGWDRQTLPQSRGAYLFDSWVKTLFARGLYGDDFFVEPWDHNRPLQTPSGISKIAEAVEALGVAAAALKERNLSLDVAWGEIVRIRFAGKDLPGSSGPGFIGAVNVSWTGRDSDGKEKYVGGNTWTSVIEFGQELRAEALLAYSNTSSKLDPSYGDQIDLVSQNRLRDVNFDDAQIQHDLAEREVLSFHN